MLTYLKHIFIITFNFISCFVKQCLNTEKTELKQKNRKECKNERKTRKNKNLDPQHSLTM